MFQRRGVAAMVCAVGISLLAGCGFEAPAVTNTEHSEVQGTNYLVGQIHIASVFVTPNPALPSTLNVVVTFVNNGPRVDFLDSAASPQGPVALSGGPLRLLPGVPVQIVDPNIDPTGSPTMVVRPTGTVPVAGQYVALSFHFVVAGASFLKSVPVVPTGETESPFITLPTGQATPPPIDLPPATSS